MKKLLSVVMSLNLLLLPCILTASAAEKPLIGYSETIESPDGIICVDYAESHSLTADIETKISESSPLIGYSKTFNDGENIICADYAPDGFVPKDEPLGDFIPPSMDFLTEQTVTRSATKVLYVNEPCDQSWRNKYPDSWMWQAYRVVAESDHILEDKIGVQFRSKSQKYWNRSSTSDSAQLNEAIDEWGLSGADMMIAFSAYLPGTTMGLAKLGKPYAIIFDYGYDANWGVGQHEVGHTYGLHDYCTGKQSDNCCTNACIMNGGHKDKICSRCLNTLIANKNKY